MAITLANLRDEAKSTQYGGAFQLLIEEHPIFRRLQWVPANAGDRHAYGRIRGVATAPSFDPDSTIASGDDEHTDPMVAFVRPCGGNIDVPIVGQMLGSAADRIRGKVVAVGKEYQNIFYGGEYSTVTVPGSGTAIFSDLQASPYWDLTTRGGGGILKTRTVSPTEHYISFMYNGDTNFGPEESFTTVDKTNVYFSSSNVNYWLRADVDISAATDAVGTWYDRVSVTSTTNQADGLITLARGGQTLDVGTAAGETFDISHLDTVIRYTKGSNKVISMPLATYDSLLAQVRTLGGITLTDVQDMPGIQAYRGVPLIPDEGVPHTLTFGGTANCGYIVCMDLADGIRGVFGTSGASYNLDGEVYGGLYIREFGELESYDMRRTRVTGYFGVAHFNYQGLTVLRGITD